MKAVWSAVAVLVLLGITGVLVWKVVRRDHEGMKPPAPAAPEAPQWKPPVKPEPPPAAEKPKPKPPPLSALVPASKDPPLYGLPLEYRLQAPEVPLEIAEPSPPPDPRRPDGKPKVGKPTPVTPA
jgi:peroxidase